MLISVGTSAVPCSSISAMMSSVMPVPCSMQSMPALIRPGSASSPNTCAVTRAPSRVGRGDRLDEDVIAPQRREIAGAPVDPVADQLDPAVAAAGLLATSAGSCDSSSISIGRPGMYRLGRAMAAGADDARQVVALVEAAGVDGRPGVAQQQGARVALDLGLAMASSASVAATGPSPTWQWASTRPGMIQPPVRTPEHGLGAGDRLGAEHAVEPTHRSTGSPSGSPLTANAGGPSSRSATSAGNLSLREVEVVEAGRQLVETLRHVRQVREARRAWRPGDAERAARTFGGVGPRPPFLPFLFLPLDLAGVLRPNGMPIWPAIADIILRASKKRSTSWLTSATFTPEPLAMRSRREPLMILGSRARPASCRG